MREMTTGRRGGRRLGALTALAGTVLTAAAIVVAGSSGAEAAPPEVFAGFRNAALQTGSNKFIAKLNVPAGSYAITAKLGAFSNADDSYVEIRTLSAGGDFDRSFTRLTGSGAEQGLSHNLVHTFPSAGPIQLECVGTSPQATTLLEFIKITATKVNSVSNGPLQ